jgi:hypothetical protein
LRSLIVTAVCGAVTISTISSLLAVAAAQLPRRGAVGVLYAAVGAGGLVGSVIAGRRPPRS